ncbi:MAG: glucose 1-dehydrogenase [Actinobacteria bacterium]|nr:glucose 1-dehydrogenase [Actinomycetota bacterium]
MGTLDGKVAIITGAARGQGAEEARLFAGAGAHVVITDVLDEPGERTAGSIDGAEYLRLDVTSEEGWERVVADVVARHGRLDVLVNNAGIYSGGQLVNVRTEEWDRVIAVNQTGVFLGMRTAARAMIAAGNGGSIVNISSIAGMMGIFGGTAYGATKWAVRGMTKVAAKELGRHGIRVNSIHPGYIETDMLSEAGLDDQERLARTVPLRRMGTVTDIASMALFLAGETAAYCTGQEFVVDGGVWG